MIMSKGSGRGCKGGAEGGGSKDSHRGPSGPGGNWPSTAPNSSGGGRENATPKGK